MKLAVIYAILALIATAANIGSQAIAIAIYAGAYGVMLSVLVGTAVGLVIKYILDKRYIFRFKAQDAVHDGKTFALYTIMGLLTTVVFWGFEFSFHYAFHTDELRFLGGAIGLMIGYTVKYKLDKRFVFRTSVPQC